jgi:hypothetical protein
MCNDSLSTDTERALLLRVADVRHAVSRVVNVCARGILDLPDKAQPRFAVATRVERLPGGVSPVPFTDASVEMLRLDATEDVVK